MRNNDSRYAKALLAADAGFFECCECWCVFEPVVEVHFELCCHGQGKFLRHTITLQPRRSRKGMGVRMEASKKAYSTHPTPTREDWQADVQVRFVAFE